MALYALSQRTTATTAASASWEVRSTSANKPKIMELGISQTTAVAGVYGVGRPGAIGVTPTSPQTFVDEGDGNGPAANTTAAVAWTTGPTVPTNFNRRLSCNATIGVGAIFTFPRGFGIPVSGSVVVWIIATAPVCDVYAVVDE
jgi:hypothetical protein